MHFKYLLWAAWAAFMAMFVLKALKERKEAARRRAIEQERVRESEAWQAVCKLLPSNFSIQDPLLKRLQFNKNTELLHKLEHMLPSGRLALQHVTSVVQESEDRIRSIRELAKTLGRAIRACKEFLQSPVRDRQHGIRQELPKVKEQLQYAAARIQNEHDAIQTFVVDTIADIINGHAEIATNFAGNWENVISQSVSKCEALLPVAIPALQQARRYLRW